MTSMGEAWQLGHRPALDGLRGIAVLLVVASHIGVPGFVLGGGNVGVTVFFTLSGFLITCLLLQEHAATGRVSLGDFFKRRALRLLPALATMVVAVVALSIAAPGDGVIAITYLANWAMVPAKTESALQHTWSLSVEEQFYVVWPLVFVLAAGRFGRLGVAVAAGLGAFGSVAVNLLLWAPTGEVVRRVYYGSDTRSFGLFVGCLLAVAVSAKGAPVASRRATAVLTVATVGLGLGGALPPVGSIVVLPLVAAALTAVLLRVLAGHGPVPWLTASWLTYVGRRSYGIYLWHYPVVVVLRDLDAAAWTMAVTTIAATGLLAEASWRLIERTFLRLKGPIRTVTHGTEASGQAPGARARTGPSASTIHL